jgi:SAM-dependent methyltransferase
MSDVNQNNLNPGNKNLWETRYSAYEYAFGKAPNAFFKSVIDSYEPGKILIPAAGEGRDAVYAAEKGWDVFAFDLSEAGRLKAMQLAQEKNVRIKYDVADVNEVNYHEGFFDMIASVFFHLPLDLRHKFYSNSKRWLKPGGVMVIESFTPEQLQFHSGGPKEVSLLMDAETIVKELADFKVIKIEERETILKEGLYHVGKASVVDFVGMKEK